VVDVDLLALELPRAGKRRLGPARVPVVAIGDQHGAIAVALAVAVARLDRHLPLAVNWRDAEHLGAEADLLAQGELIYIVVEVASDLEVVRVVRIVIRHRVGLVGHQPARGVDVQRAVCRGEFIVVFVAPVAAHLGALLEAVEGDPASVQHLARGDAGGAGTDNADLLGGGHRPKSTFRCAFPLHIGEKAHRKG
jgi:hypothetical protein